MTTTGTKGSERINWAEGRMPVLRSIARRFEDERPLDGIRVAACLHVTAETAVLARTLRRGGADVRMAAANPLSTQDDVVGALSAEEVAISSERGESAESYVAHVKDLVGAEPQITLDDGADLVTGVNAAGHEALGGTEETTTGIVRLRHLAEEGGLRYPILAVNEARTERTFNDRHGTGQSALDGILRATNILLAGHTLVLLGYGFAGKGVAERARGAGAAVVVCEVDPFRALEARMDGFEVMPILEAAERGDIFVTVTGSRSVLRSEHFERMKDGALLANAGHFDVEIDIAALSGVADGPSRQVLPLVEEFDVGGKRLHLLANGRVVNLAAAEGHPASVMDVSFALQALAVEHLIQNAGKLEPKVLAVPPELDDEVARLKLAALGVSIDELTEGQRLYLTSWA
ncbi:MAG TPA: adenosylhomocysteinase [Thermoleophilaceae bacterium]|nr:adenosylhomocysteinase [Thermoleophilaceae bacterium]